MPLPYNLLNPSEGGTEYFGIHGNLRNAAQGLLDLLNGGGDVELWRFANFLETLKSAKDQIADLNGKSAIRDYVQEIYTAYGIVTDPQTDHAEVMAEVDSLISLIATALNGNPQWSYNTTTGVRSPVLLTTGQKNAGISALNDYFAAYTSI